MPAPTNGQVPVTPSGWLDVLGPRIRYLTLLGEKDEDHCLIGGIFPPGVIIPLHQHSDRETLYVLAGGIECHVGGRWQEIGPGEVADIQADVPHALRNVAPVDASMLLVTTMRMGRFFAEVGQPVTDAAPVPPSPQAMQRFVQTAHAYGHRLGSPEENAAIGLPMPT